MSQSKIRFALSAVFSGSIARRPNVPPAESQKSRQLTTSSPPRPTVVLQRPNANGATVHLLRLPGNVGMHLTNNKTPDGDVIHVVNGKLWVNDRRTSIKTFLKKFAKRLSRLGTSVVPVGIFDKKRRNKKSRRRQRGGRPKFLGGQNVGSLGSQIYFEGAGVSQRESSVDVGHPTIAGGPNSDGGDPNSDVGCPNSEGGGHPTIAGGPNSDVGCPNSEGGGHPTIADGNPTIAGGPNVDGGDSHGDVMKATKVCQETLQQFTKFVESDDSWWVSIFIKRGREWEERRTWSKFDFVENLFLNFSSVVELNKRNLAVDYDKIVRRFLILVAQISLGLSCEASADLVSFGKVFHDKLTNLSLSGLDKAKIDAIGKSNLDMITMCMKVVYLWLLSHKSFAEIVPDELRSLLVKDELEARCVKNEYLDALVSLRAREKLDDESRVLHVQLKEAVDRLT